MKVGLHVPNFAFGEQSDPRVRGDMLDEGLQILRAAWTGTPVRHAGTHYQVDDVTFRPVRRAAALDGVFPIGLKPSDLPVLLDNVAQHRPGGLDGHDVVTVGTGNDSWQAWQDTDATWWLREPPWRRPLSESVAIVEAGSPAR